MKIHENSDFKNTSEALAIELYKYYKKSNSDIFTIVLSGGNSPKHLYIELINNYKDKFNWSNIYFFFADERFINTESEYNNYNSAKIDFFNKIPEIKSENIFHFNTSLESPEICAKNYEKTIHQFFKDNNLPINQKGIPSFDLCLLGMGPDGHTASIFPGYKEINEMKKLISATEISPTKPELERITMTFPLINNSKKIVFLLSKTGKENILNKLKTKKAAELPAALVKSKNEIEWFISKN